MSTLSFSRGPRARQEPIPAVDRTRSGTPVVVEVSSLRRISEPVSLARALKLFGLSLSEAHEVLNRFEDTCAVRVKLYVSESSGPTSSLERFGVTVRGADGSKV